VLVGVANCGWLDLVRAVWSTSCGCLGARAKRGQLAGSRNEQMLANGQDGPALRRQGRPQQGGAMPAEVKLARAGHAKCCPDRRSAPVTRLVHVGCPLSAIRNSHAQALGGEPSRRGRPGALTCAAGAGSDRVRWAARASAALRAWW
jgi:hypothetical protein